MEKRERRRFTAEYEAATAKQLAESGKARQQVAEELGVHANRLRGWRDEGLAIGSAEASARQRPLTRRIGRSVWRVLASARIVEDRAGLHAGGAVAPRRLDPAASARPDRFGEDR